MAFISYQAALKGIETFANKYDTERLNQYRFQILQDGRCEVLIYSCCGTFLGYV
jgi:hypothetical protein